MRLTALILLAVLWCSNAWASDIAVKTVAMEASNQGEQGMYLVASVIVNRARAMTDDCLDCIGAGMSYEKSLEYSIEWVCKAPKQFSCWNSPKWAKAWLDKHYGAKTREKALSALNKALVEPAKGIDHYHTTAVKPYWAKGKTPTVKWGDHVFYDLEG